MMLRNENAVENNVKWKVNNTWLFVRMTETAGDSWNDIENWLAMSLMQKWLFIKQNSSFSCVELCSLLELKIACQMIFGFFPHWRRYQIVTLFKLKDILWSVIKWKPIVGLYIFCIFIYLCKKRYEKHLCRYLERI